MDSASETQISAPPPYCSVQSGATSPGKRTWVCRVFSRLLVIGGTHYGQGHPSPSARTAAREPETSFGTDSDNKPKRRVEQCRRCNRLFLYPIREDDREALKTCERYHPGKYAGMQPSSPSKIPYLIRLWIGCRMKQKDLLLQRSCVRPNEDDDVIVVWDCCLIWNKGDQTVSKDSDPSPFEDGCCVTEERHIPYYGDR